MGLELVIGIAVGALVIGAMLGYFLPLVGGKKIRVAELEAALETAQEELADYKRDVYGEFAETAEKFRALDKSYHELHQQLAKSSVTLCGDAATPLLESQGQDTQTLAAEEIVVGETSDAAGEASEVESTDAADAEFGDAADKVDEAADPLAAADETAARDDQTVPRADDEIAVAGVETVELDDAVVDVAADELKDAGDVPILTEVDAQTDATRRESA